MNPHPQRPEGLGSLRHRRPAPGTQTFDRSNPWLFMGTRAGMARHRERKGSLLIPLDADPATFRWPMEDAFATLIADGCTLEQVQPALRALLRDGACMILCIAPGPDRTPLWMHTAHGTIYAQEIER